MDANELIPVLQYFGIGFLLVNPIIGLIILLAGYAQLSIYLCLCLTFEYQNKRRKTTINRKVDPFPKVTVIVSAFNEEKVIERCIKSICASDYPPYSVYHTLDEIADDELEVIVVDDGSTDSTPQILDNLSVTKPIMSSFAGPLKLYSIAKKIKVIHKANGGKASALNVALTHATGDIIVVMDADTLLHPLAIRKMVAHFSNPNVGAVCGYDMPSNPNNWLVKLLTLSSHVSTGFVRRALSVLDCIMVVNFGAFRHDVLKKAGGFVDTIGEDFELTLKVHKLGYKIEFEPGAIGLSESPSSLSVLWHQRVRWFRGYLHAIRLHKDMLGRSKFGIFLVLNIITNVIFPWFLFAAFVFVIGGLMLGSLSLNGFNLNSSVNILYFIISFFGLIPTFVIACYSLSLDHNFKKYASFLYVFPMWIIYSVFLDLVAMDAMILEIVGTNRKWKHWIKTGDLAKETKVTLG